MLSLRRAPLAGLVAGAIAVGCSTSPSGDASCASGCQPDAGAPASDAASPLEGSAGVDAGSACAHDCADAAADGHVPPGTPDSGAPSADAARDGGMPPPQGGPTPRVVAYVNVICGFGAGARGGECLPSPDPTVNSVKQWEDAGQSPITHYVLSFLSFTGQSTDLQTDPGEIWKGGGGSTTDFTLDDGVRAALASAKANGKKVFLSIGGQVGSSGFLSWWSSLGGSSGVSAMGQKLQHAADLFAQANGFAVDGFDVDIELGGAYAKGSQDYLATRDLIDAVPESFLVAFVPQIGNGLCAAPVAGDPLTAAQTLGGECSTSSSNDDSAWALAELDSDCRRSDGTPKLDYWGIQYYNAGQATCCGGGPDTPTAVESIWQNYKNLANGWPASPANASWPGPWPAFGGFGASRLVLGKPGCQGCAGSNYLSLSDMQSVLAGLDGKLHEPAGGFLFWDLGRLFGNTGPQCVSGTCPPSWGDGGDVRGNLAALAAAMAALKTGP